MEKFDFVAIGGGAAGFFGAIQCAEHNPQAKIAILEATPRVLSKVKVSGGGRCNVTHHCFEPKDLVKFYPRGSKELLGPFHKFGPRQTIDWFVGKGVELKVESDGRMFPITDSSQTIIDCLQKAVQDSGIELRTKCLVQKINYEEGVFLIALKSGEVISSRTVLLASGSAAFGWDLLEGLGHTMIEPRPSLFTFEIKHPLLEPLPGVSFARVTADLHTAQGVFQQTGPMLITHWGLSGPAILRLSAFGARALAETGYQAKLFINFEDNAKLDDTIAKLQLCKTQESKKKLSSSNPTHGPKRFWEALLASLQISADMLWADLSKKDMNRLAESLCRCAFEVTGKGVFKEEFVTAGGVPRQEVDFRSFQSKKLPGLFLAGEVIDIDGVTGGFNFQNAWTGGYLAGKAAAEWLQENTSPS